MSYTLLKTTTPKARVNHKCIWCGEQIEAGDIYIHEKAVFDGSVQDHKWHPECSVADQEEHDGEAEWEIRPFENERPSPETETNDTTNQ